MTYKASQDNLTKGLTIGVTILFIFIIIGQYRLERDYGHIMPVVTIILLVAVYLGAYMFRPVSYEITADKLIICRLYKNVTLDRSRITSVELLPKGNMGTVFRTFGVGGLFGYFGKFASTKQGGMTWYATRRDHRVLVKTDDNRKIILTPDDPEGFMKELEG